MTQVQAATEILRASGVLELECLECQGSGGEYFHEENRNMPCDTCNGTGFRFWQLRRPCPQEHWAGNTPEDCHGRYYPLPQQEYQLVGILLGVSVEFQQHPFLVIAQSYWDQGLEAMAKTFVTIAKTDQCPHCLGLADALKRLGG